MDKKENQSYVENEEMKKLPIGFRFHPTDEELVVHYLTRKAFSFPLPAIIPQFDVFHTHPSNLPGYLNENRHFFTRRNVDGKKSIIKDGFGYWKACGIKKQIKASQINHVVGMKRSLVFYQLNNNNHVFKTSWVMHEFSLPHFTQKCVMEIEDWVVCRVFEKKKSLGRKRCYLNNRIKNTNHTHQEIKQCCSGVIENSEVGPPELSSSEITAEISVYGATDEEVSSGCKFSFKSS